MNAPRNQSSDRNEVQETVSLAQIQLTSSPPSPEQRQSQRDILQLSTIHWNQFLSSHRDWFNNRQQESDFVYPLPLRFRLSFVEYFGISSANEAAESRYAELCRDFHAVTWHRGQPLNSPMMEGLLSCAPLNPFPDELLQGMLKLGWTEANIAAVPVLLQIGDHALGRAQSIAGRLVCKPEYLRELFELKCHWEELPAVIRPGFPLRRPETILTETPPEPNAVLPISGFMQLLIRFLDKWELIQLTTWLIPEPQGLQRYVPQTGGGRPESAPLGFPVQERDGLGRVFMRRHRQRAGESGLNDLDRHQLYRHLWEIEFWEFVLVNRYVLEMRSDSTDEQSRMLLGQLLDLHPDRVKQYQRIRNRLKSGLIATLRRVR